MEKSIKLSNSSSNLLKFIVPSLIGILLFMTPILYGGEITIPIAILSKFVLNSFEAVLPKIMTGIVCTALLGTFIAKVFKPKIFLNSEFLNTLFNVSPLWFVSRTAGAVFAVFTLFQIGPQWIWSENTGGLLLNDLLPILFSVFLFADMFL